MVKRKHTAPAYILERLEELRLLKTAWPWRRRRVVRRAALHAAHQRFREYAGPKVTLEPIGGRILATFELTLEGYQHEPEML